MLAAVFLAASRAPGSETSYRIEPPPDWVEPVNAASPRTFPSDQIREGVYYLLADTQIAVVQGTKHRFQHFVKKIVNESGLSAGAQITVEFDPAYETLILHRLRIHRNGDSVDRLPDTKIEVIQRETELDYQIYQGSLSAIAFLEDVRVGDLIDYAYTIRGSNPIFAGHFADALSVQWPVPVQEIRHRLLWPAHRRLFIKNHGTSLAPTRRSLPGIVQYNWRATQVPPLIADEHLPTWYTPYPWVQLSDFATWAELADWGKSLFSVPESLSPALQAQIGEWKSEHRKSEDRVLAALRFVQDEVRYLGIELGANSHKPYSPNLVFERRFGDCKDKALLLCTILRSLNIEACPTLVSTHSLHTVEDWHPSPLAFNHAVVRVRLNRKDYWLDPTLTHQRGTLESMPSLGYGRALVLDKGVSGLTPVPFRPPAIPTTIVKETFVVEDYSSPVEYRVESKYSGRDANQMRARFAESSLEEVQKDYLNYYTNSFPSIELVERITVTDDPSDNVFTSVEHYRLPDFWLLSEDKNMLIHELSPSTIEDIVRVPESPHRSMPLGIPHPVHVRHITHMLLPEEWEVEPESLLVEGRAVRFEYNSSYQNRSIQLEYTYQTLKDFVDPPDLVEHLNDIDRIREILAYQIYRTVGSDTAGTALTATPQPNWSIVLLSMFFLGLCSVGALKAYRYEPTPRGSAPVSDPKLEGIGGWLLLLALAVVVNPVRLSYDIAGNMEVYGLESWKVLTSPGSDVYHPLWEPLLILELFCNILLLVYSILLVALFFQKKALFPRLFIAFMILNFATITVDAFVYQWIGGVEPSEMARLYRDIGQTILRCIVWIPYMLASRRVRATFVRTGVRRPTAAEIWRARARFPARKKMERP